VVAQCFHVQLLEQLTKRQAIRLQFRTQFRVSFSEAH
jgi:hypothetical protein